VSKASRRQQRLAKQSETGGSTGSSGTSSSATGGTSAGSSSGRHSTSPTGTPQNLAGILGAPGTRTLIGALQFNDAAQSGLRFNVGYWLNPLQTLGIQAGAFWLANHDSSSGFVSTGDPILARPYFDALTSAQSAELIAFPGFSSGSGFVSTHTSLNGWDVALRQNATCFCNGRIDGIVGYRQLRLADQLAIFEEVTSQTTPGPRGLLAGSQFLAVDRFDTLNEFYGAEVGFLAGGRGGPDPYRHRGAHRVGHLRRGGICRRGAPSHGEITTAQSSHRSLCCGSLLGLARAKYP
jgi:hypothetical protein